ncbi:hypothetical protein GQ457_03G007810 [Hibiscus cannabinus]
MYYAFGLVLLELLTGHRAVELNQGPSDQNLVVQVGHNILHDRKKLRKVIDPEMAPSQYTVESITMFSSLASRCVRVKSREQTLLEGKFDERHEKNKMNPSKLVELELH